MNYLGLWLLVFAGFTAQAATIHQKTEGWCSPAVGVTEGDVTITCQGVDPKVLQWLNELLSKKDLELQDKIGEVEAWTRKYQELSQRIATQGQNGARAQEAQALLEAGKLAGEILFTEAYNKAKEYREVKNYAEAIAYYKLALQINPDYFGAYYNLADSYQKIGQSEEALQNFEKALNLSPNNARSHYNMANLYQQKGEDTKAKEHYKKVIELEAEDSDLSRRARKNLKALGE
jgi:tetratricopeptide (TPR) repeat protein